MSSGANHHGYGVPSRMPYWAYDEPHPPPRTERDMMAGSRGMETQAPNPGRWPGGDYVPPYLRPTSGAHYSDNRHIREFSPQDGFSDARAPQSRGNNNQHQRHPQHHAPSSSEMQQYRDGPQSPHHPHERYNPVFDPYDVEEADAIQLPESRVASMDGTLRHRRPSKRDRQLSQYNSQIRRQSSLRPQPERRFHVQGRTCWAKHCFSHDFHSHPLTSRRYRDILKTKGYELTDEENLSSKWRNVNKSWKGFWDNFKIWNGALKNIEGAFGRGVVSYFGFIRWLLMLNIVMFLLVFVFVTLPNIIFDPTSSTHFTDTGENQTCGNFKTNVSEETLACCNDKYQQSIVMPSDFEDHLLDFLQGTGWMENTVLFYGYYNSYVLGFGSNYKYEYKMTLAYLFVTFAYLMLCLLSMVNSAATTWKTQITATKASSSTYKLGYIYTAFTGWDYTLSNEKSVNQHHTNIYLNLTTQLHREIALQETAERTTSEKCQIYTVRLLVNLFVIAALGGAGYLIYYVTDRVPELIEKAIQREASSIEVFFYEYLPSITITGVYIVVSVVFNNITRLERLTPETELKITLFRIVFLRLASIAVLVWTVLSGVSAKNCKRKVGDCDTCNNENLETTVYCWETYLGQQIYKLIVLDFFIMIGVTLFIEFPRKLLVSYCECLSFIGYQEFIIPTQVLDLVYIQALCWLGTYFSPLIPGMCVISFFVRFYVKKISLMYNFTPSTRASNASRTNAFFLVVLIIAFFLCLIPLGLSIFSLKASLGCGLYGHKEFVFDVVKDLINGINFDPLKELLVFVGSNLALLICVILLLMIIYYYRTKTIALEKVIRKLEGAISDLKQDRAFVSTIIEVGQETTSPSRRI